MVEWHGWRAGDRKVPGSPVGPAFPSALVLSELDGDDVGSTPHKFREREHRSDRLVPGAEARLLRWSPHLHAEHVEGARLGGGASASFSFSRPLGPGAGRWPTRLTRSVSFSCSVVLPYFC